MWPVFVGVRSGQGVVERLGMMVLRGSAGPLSDRRLLGYSGIVVRLANPASAPEIKSLFSQPVRGGKLPDNGCPRWQPGMIPKRAWTSSAWGRLAWWHR